MSAEPQLFRINPENRESEKITEVDFARLGFQERRDIQEWVAANPGILDDGLLIIGKEFSGFDRTNERLDLLAVDIDGKLVVIELKRDHTGSDAHWQAIKYASYLHRARDEDIIRMYASYANISESEATDELLQHLGTDDLNVLNNDQRIILASHRFAPEVTSASLWLNQKVPAEDLITCVQLIPYQDTETDRLYIQANTIIPMPGIEDYVIGVGDSSDGNNPVVGGTSSLKQTFERNRTDEVTRFLKDVGELTTDGLSPNLKPNRKSRWAGEDHEGRRYYHLWYSRSPWGNWDMSYWVQLYLADESGPEVGTWQADVGFAYLKSGKQAVFSESQAEEFEARLASTHVYDDSKRMDGRFGGTVVSRQGKTLDDNFANEISGTLRPFIEELTPIVDEFEDERSNQEDAQ